MSNSNENNRPDIAVRLGTIADGVSIALLYAHKTMLLRNAALVFDTAVNHTAAANFVFFLRERMGAESEDVTNPVTTEEDVALGTPLDLGVDDEYILEKGHVLELVVGETGAPADVNGTFTLDYQVKGN